MRFINVRDLRGKPARVWRELARERELVITLNGRPIAILSAVSEDNLEESLAAIRQSRAIAAVESMQRSSRRAGRDRLTDKEIETEIAAVRSKRWR